MAAKDFLWPHVKDYAYSIVHVGSTAIPGLSAKPVIDLDIIVNDDDKTLQSVIHKLEDLGYIHLGERGISGREAFQQPSHQIPNSAENMEWFKHHLYVCTLGSVGLNNHLSLKKHLLEHPEKVKAYSDLKELLAEKFPNDMDAYVEGKTNFIVQILKEEGLPSADAELIEKENKKPT